ncbi:hypothetical protein PENSPDRAFT_657035 [Peniophora sp. CONT]|nr:hypothetical protein PENSPDRAFT_657035 [Peniophora sp. CONT]
MAASTPAGSMVTPRMRTLIKKAGSGFLTDEAGGKELRVLYQRNSSKLYAQKAAFGDFAHACYCGDEEYVTSAILTGRAPPLDTTVSEYELGLATLIVFGAHNLRPLGRAETEKEKTRHLRVLKFLLANGLPPDVPDIVRGTALGYAVMKVDDKMPALIHALIAGGANVNNQCIYGSTPLSDAMLVGQAHIVDILMEAGARLDLPDANGTTCMDTYVNYGPQVTAVVGKWLRRRAGAGQTLLENACSNCGKLGDEKAELMRCSSCRAVLYCSTACQRAQWQSHKKTCKALSSGEDAVTLKPFYQESSDFGLQPAAAAYRESVLGMHEVIPHSHLPTAHQPKKFPKSLLVKIQVPYSGSPTNAAVPGGNFMVYSKGRDFVAQIRREDAPAGYDQMFEVISTKGPGGAKGYFLAELKSATELVVKTQILAEQPF